MSMRQGFEQLETFHIERPITVRASNISIFIGENLDNSLKQRCFDTRNATALAIPLYEETSRTVTHTI